MSWSVGAWGKAPAVRTAIAAQFEKGGKCSELEETIRQSAAKIIDAALAGQDPSTVVEVSASGSQSTNGTVVTSNVVNIAVTPRYSFLE
jgi:hypothetical protein